MTDPFPAAMRDEFTLPNGLRMVGERLPWLRSVSVGVWLKSGSAFEGPEENGLSHFFEHMLFKGTAKRSARRIAEEIDETGGTLDAFTAKDCTCVYAAVIDEDLPLALDVLSDMLLNAALDPAELDRERGVILEEIASDEDDAEEQAHDLLSAAQYAGQPLGQTILGPAEAVSAFTRDRLAAWRAARYRPQDTVISVCGRYDPSALRELLEEKLGAWRSDAPSFELPAMVPADGNVRVREREGEQLHLCFGWPGVPYGSGDTYALAALNSIAGGAASSRLFQRLREELGMAYSVYSYPSAYPRSGVFAVYAGVSPEQAEQAAAEILREIDRLRREGIPDREFLSAVSQLRGGYLLGLESPFGRMQTMGRAALLLGRAPAPEEILADIERVRKEDAERLADELFRHTPCVSASGQGAEAFGRRFG